MKFRTSHAALLLGACAAGFTAYSVGCSLPDRTYFDDTAGSGNAGRGNAGEGSGGSPAGGSSSEAGGPGEAGDTGTGGDPGSVRPTPTKGLIVIGGTAIDQTEGVLSVLDAASGAEVARETLPNSTQVAAIAYDGADKKHVWYVFVGADFPAKPDKVVDLQVRYFDDTTNEWITLSKLTTLAPPVPGTMTVLNDRLAYLSHVVEGGKAVPSLTILDTTNVKAVKTIAAAYNPPTPFNGELVTLIGTRGSASDPGGVGGTLDLGLKRACTKDGICELFVQPIPVGDAIGTVLGHVLGTFQGNPVAYASQLEQLDYFALSPATGSVQVYRSTPTAPEDADNFTAPQSANDLMAMTVAECQNTALVTAEKENALYGVTLGAGSGVTLDLGRAGQLVAYEPFSQEIITTYNPPTDDFVTAPADAGIPGPEISAVTVQSTGGVALKMTPRTEGWAPPVDVRANVLVTRFPVPFKCP